MLACQKIAHHQVPLGQVMPAPRPAVRAGEGVQRAVAVNNANLPVADVRVRLGQGSFECAHVQLLAQMPCDQQAKLGAGERLRRDDIACQSREQA